MITPSKPTDSPHLSIRNSTIAGWDFQPFSLQLPSSPLSTPLKGACFFCLLGFVFWVLIMHLHRQLHLLLHHQLHLYLYLHLHHHHLLLLLLLLLILFFSSSSSSSSLGFVFVVIFFGLHQGIHHHFCTTIWENMFVNKFPFASFEATPSWKCAAKSRLEMMNQF